MDRLNPVTKAVLWMLGTLLSFSLMAIAGKELSATLSTFEILFFRSIVGLLLLCAVIHHRGWGLVKTRQLSGHVFRNIAQRILIGIIEGLIQEYVVKKALLVLDKLLGNEQKKKEDGIKKQNALLQQQIALQAILLALGGGGGGGGFFGFAEGGQVKARADGGGVGRGAPYMVGERGRELFVPNQDGEIVSNERLQNLGATVNFTINATDVKGVKELLIDNRATIVNIINGALNQKGKAALV